jgi:hypothetical protein
MIHLNFNYFKIKSRIHLLMLLLVVFSCSKEKNESWIQGKLIIKETGQPLKNFSIIFDVLEGGGGCLGSLGCGGTLVQGKYHATSDDNGHFSFKVDRDDRGKIYYVHPDYYTCDSLKLYTLSNWSDSGLSKDNNTTLYFSPRGYLDFYASDTTFAALGVDTILVKSKYATNILSKPGWRNIPLYVEPSKVHTFTYQALKNGKVINEISKDIYVQHPCSAPSVNYGLGYLGFYEAKFD